MQVFILVNKKQRGPMCLFMPMKSKAKKIYQNFLLGLWLTGFNGQLKQKQKGVRFKTVFIVNEKRLHSTHMSNIILSNVEMLFLDILHCTIIISTFLKGPSLCTIPHCPKIICISACHGRSKCINECLVSALLYSCLLAAYAVELQSIFGFYSDTAHKSAKSASKQTSAGEREAKKAT